MSQKALENTNEMCSCSLGILYDTPQIELIKYGRRIGKKVYYCKASSLCGRRLRGNRKENRGMKKLTARTEDEDPAGCQRCGISRKQI